MPDWRSYLENFLPAWMKESQPVGEDYLGAALSKARGISPDYEGNWVEKQNQLSMLRRGLDPISQAINDEKQSDIRGPRIRQNTWKDDISDMYRSFRNNVAQPVADVNAVMALGDPSQHGVGNAVGAFMPGTRKAIRDIVIPRTRKRVAAALEGFFTAGDAVPEAYKNKVLTDYDRLAGEYPNLMTELRSVNPKANLPKSFAGEYDLNYLNVPKKEARATNETLALLDQDPRNFVGEPQGSGQLRLDRTHQVTTFPHELAHHAQEMLSEAPTRKYLSLGDSKARFGDDFGYWMDLNEIGARATQNNHAVLGNGAVASKPKKYYMQKAGEFHKKGLKGFEDSYQKSRSYADQVADEVNTTIGTHFNDPKWHKALNDWAREILPIMNRRYAGPMAKDAKWYPRKFQFEPKFDTNGNFIGVHKKRYARVEDILNYY